MRNPNGFGGVSRLPGNRKRPWRARVTQSWQPREGRRPLQKYLTVGYYTSREEALQALAEFNRQPFNADLKDLTFHEVYVRWSARYFEKFPSTRRVSDSTMLHCRSLWDRPMRELRTADLQAVIDGMNGLSHAYQAKARSLMHMLFEWCMKQDILFRDYSAFVELAEAPEPSEKKVFKREEVRLLCRLSEEQLPIPGEPEVCADLHLIDTLPVLLYTGLRIGELLALRKEDVHLDERYIQVQGTKTRAARRIVPIHKTLLPYMARVMERPGELLFPDRKGRQMTYSQYKYTWFNHVMPALQLDHSPHETRHTFISRMDTAGIPRTIQKFIAGHSLSMDVTDRYTHKEVEELVRQIDKLDYETPDPFEAPHPVEG